MSNRIGTARIWSVSVGAAVLLAGCGSEGDTFDPGADAYRLQAIDYSLPNAEPALDLTDPDAILTAALAAITLGELVTVGDIGAIDGGGPVGQQQFDCDAGTVVESVSTSGGGRTLTLTSDQCFGSEAQTVQDGILSLSYSQPFPGGVEGSLAFGFGAESLQFSGEADVTSADLIDVVQLKGTIDFEGERDGSSGIATTSGMQVFIGRGPRPGAGDSFLTNRRLEMLGGGVSAAFTADTSQLGAGHDLIVEGPVSIEGSGSALDPVCSFAGRYSVATPDPLLLSDVDSADQVPRTGELILSTGAGSATVEFDGNGNARVTPLVGLSVDYTADEVRSFCGL